ncbi:MAG: hypothetical protein U0790_23275 [Isosphaeraceae bacterium]
MPTHAARSRNLGVLACLAIAGLAVFHEVQPMIHANPHPAEDKGPAKSPDRPFVVEYYYTAKWGHADEFLTLFRKNHYPVLRKQIEKGRMRSVSMTKPRYHATEDGRWDFKVTIVFKDVESAFAPAGEEEAIKKELFPDQETFRREEARRFEILLAHWDVPITDVELEP